MRCTAVFVRNREALVNYWWWRRSHCRRTRRACCVLLPQKEKTECKSTAPNAVWCVSYELCKDRYLFLFSFLVFFCHYPLCHILTPYYVSHHTDAFRWTEQLQQVIEKIRGTDIHLRATDVVMGKKFATGGNGQIHEGILNGNINVALKESYGSIMKDDRCEHANT